MENETWKPVPFPPFDEYYEVSTLGRLRVLKGRQGTKAGKILKATVRKTGHCQYVFKAPGIKPLPMLLHRVVALAHIPNPDGLAEVNHRDGDKSNNGVDNLEWMTRQENMKHAYENGLMHVGTQNHATKLTDDQIREIRRRVLEGGESRHQMAKEFGIGVSHCSRIVSGKVRRFVD